MLRPWEKVIAANLVDTVRRRIPLVWHSTKCGAHELMPDRSSPNDPGRAVTEGRAVWISDPDCRRQCWCVAKRPIVAEFLGSPGLGRPRATGGGEAPPRPELHPSIAIVGEHGAHDEGRLGADRLECILARVVIVDGMTEGIADAQDRCRFTSYAEVGQRRRA